MGKLYQSITFPITAEDIERVQVDVSGQPVPEWLHDDIPDIVDIVNSAYELGRDGIEYDAKSAIDEALQRFHNIDGFVKPLETWINLAYTRGLQRIVSDE